MLRPIVVSAEVVVVVYAKQENKSWPRPKDVKSHEERETAFQCSSLLVSLSQRSIAGEYWSLSPLGPSGSSGEGNWPC
jgi:hypothetical protein